MSVIKLAAAALAAMAFAAPLMPASGFELINPLSVITNRAKVRPKD